MYASLRIQFEIHPQAVISTRIVARGEIPRENTTEYNHLYTHSPSVNLSFLQSSFSFTPHSFTIFPSHIIIFFFFPFSKKANRIISYTDTRKSHWCKLHSSCSIITFDTKHNIIILIATRHFSFYIQNIYSQKWIIVFHIYYVINLIVTKWKI